MVNFTQNKIQSIETLGEKLSRHRQEMGLTINKAAGLINVNARYLKYLENDDYVNLPAPIYTQNFLRRYAELLNLNTDTVIFLHQKEKSFFEKTHHYKKLTTSAKTAWWQKFGRLILRPTFIKYSSISLIFLLVLFYIGFSINNIFSPPEIIIKSPAETSLITDNHTIDIIGITEKEVELMINSRQILYDQDGRFSLQIELQKGVNIIKITAKKKHSKTNTVYRQILVTDPPTS
ncbi:TPA: hypothetical protein DF272_04540 [Candidatus Falkowbacteria bacterium]|nr:hypothetical protein [Candidatus Falkowbacteria bacterium]